MECGGKAMASAGGTYFILVRHVLKSDFTNRMILGVSNRTGRSQRHPCRKAPKIAIHGDFPLEVFHSISEIADFSPEPYQDEIGAARRCHCLSPAFHSAPLAV